MSYFLLRSCYIRYIRR